MLRLDGYADHTTKETWDYSAWVRVYSVYLDERLGVFKAMRFDPELETSGGVPPPIAPDGFPGAAVPPPPPPPQQGQAPRETKLKSCPAHELLEHLPLVRRRAYLKRVWAEGFNGKGARGRTSCWSTCPW